MKANDSSKWDKVWKSNSTYSGDDIRDYITRQKMIDMQPILQEVRLLKPSPSIADIGCGDGLMMFQLCHVLDATFCFGVDISNEAIGRARANASLQKINNCNLILSNDPLLLPIEDSCVDVVISLGVIEHIDTRLNQMLNLQEFFRVLRPGGLVIFMVPNILSLGVMDRIYQQFRGRWPFGFQKEMSIQAARSLFKKAGFAHINSYVKHIHVVPSIDVPLRYRLIQRFDGFFGRVFRNCGFYLYALFQKDDLG